jgi:hypothetical protein
MQGAARRVAVWADIARVAWKFSADVVGVGKLTDAPFAPAVNFVAVRPIALYGPSSTNPEYRLERSSVTVDIECGVIEETTPLDECKAYRQGACRVVVIAYGDTKDLKRITDGA